MKNKSSEKTEHFREFAKFTKLVSEVIGHPLSFILAFFIIVISAVGSIIFNHTETWELLVNTFSGIITLLLLFILQNSQNRDARMFHIKLDELIRSHHVAKNTTIDLETLSDKKLKELEETYKELSERNDKIPDVDIKK